MKVTFNILNLSVIWFNFHLFLLIRSLIAHWCIHILDVYVHLLSPVWLLILLILILYFYFYICYLHLYLRRVLILHFFILVQFSLI